MRWIILFVSLNLLFGCRSFNSSQLSANNNLPASDFDNIKVMFHPVDPTLEEIAKYFEEAQSTIDIAMYNFDTSSTSPIIQQLSSPEMQDRINSGDIEVRAIFQGYKKPRGNQTVLQANEAACIALEELGVDVRRFIPGEDPRWQFAVKVHHKFAVIDGYTSSPKLITGSANWSKSSREKYDENILFVKEVNELTGEFQEEFNVLWATSAEYGEDLSDDPTGQLPAGSTEFPGVDAFFNSDNYNRDGDALELDSNVLVKSPDQSYVLTNKIVEAIDSAETSLKIGTTRITLRDVISAIGRAVDRGVNVEIVLNMDQYKTFARAPIRQLAAKGPDIKVKYYNLAFDRSSASGMPTYLTYQMHSKYLIVDDRIVLTGSFNWSRSGEYNHMENVVGIDTRSFQTVKTRFLENFSDMQNLNSDEYTEVKEAIQASLDAGTEVGCKFTKPMALTLEQIDELLALGEPHGVTLKDDCNMAETIR